jgi:tetratricopeptide (TPR) repeat protein
MASTAGSSRSDFASFPFWPFTCTVLILGLAPGPRSMATVSSHSFRIGATSMAESRTASLLVDYYEAFLKDHDLEAFQRQVGARYTEGTLCRLVQSGEVRARRAAVLALGLVGTFEVNETLAQALRDSDPAVRSLADNALWAIWFRADSPENNQALERVRALIVRGRLEEAIVLAGRLISRAPRFAEVYNQRAIALYQLGRFDESAKDCRRVLELNPYHFGALGGLAQCYMELNLRREALQTLRRALRIQPYNDDLKGAVKTLEADG